jgi:hypothetical protein
LRVTPNAQAKPITPPFAIGSSVSVAKVKMGIDTAPSNHTDICHVRSARNRSGTIMCSTRNIVTYGAKSSDAAQQAETQVRRRAQCDV